MTYPHLEWYGLDQHRYRHRSSGGPASFENQEPDKYTRSLGKVFLVDLTSVHQKLVKDGWCWRYRNYAPEDTVLRVLEQEARTSKRGLWVDPSPTPPWKWRKRGQAVP